MRVKQIWAVIPLPSKLKLAYSRVTLNLPTTVFFVLALVQCLLQISFHIWLYTHRPANLGPEGVALNSTIITFPLAVQTGNNLLLCKDIPTLAGGPDKCIKAHLSTPASRRSLTATPEFNANGEMVNITLVDSITRDQVLVPKQCVDVLPWLYQSLRAMNRDDITFVVFHAWLFGISMTAILNESIPHLIAALALAVLCTIGSANRILETSRFQLDFNRIVVDGSCNGVDLFLGESYFQSRRSVEISICVVNAITLVAFTGISWRLIKTYGQRSFERVNKRSEMSRLYIVILTMGTCIQVAVFYMVAAIGLFFDQLTLGPLRNLTEAKPLYLAADIILLALVIPWVILGWTSGRMESKPRTLAFFAITIILMSAWASMFTSPAFHLLILTWNSFAMATIISMILMVVTLLLSLYSWFHLDVGLAEYLKAEEPPHPADNLRWSLAITSDPEKCAAPTSGDGLSKPQVTWVHPPSPIISKPSTTTQKITQSHLNALAPTKDSTGSHRVTNNISSTRMNQPGSVSLERDPYPPLHPPGLKPLPYGLPVISIPTAPNQTSPSLSVPLKMTEFEQIPPPPQAVLEAAAIRHRIADDIVIPKRLPLDGARAVGERRPPVIGFPARVKPSQRNRL